MHSKISAVVAFLHITDTSRLLKALKDDKRAIFTAAARAQEALAWMIARQSKAQSSADVA